MTTYATTRAKSKAALRDRIVVGGVDISYFRDKSTPPPSYRLLEPFGYGTATIAVPQVRPHLEAGSFGTGDLSWVRTGAFVKIHRVDDAETVQARDYRGRVMAIRADGNNLVLEVGGLVTGPASVRNHQVPVYRRIKDIGAWAFDGLVNYGNFPGVEFTPRLGPATGIEVVEAGGMSHLGWLQQLCSLGVTKAGAQWTIMPVVPGSNAFEMRLKDTTTKHATIWVDDSRSVAALLDDTAESFTTGYGSGVTKEGMIWDGTVLPGVEDAAAPPFPGNLSTGDSGENVIVVNWKLIWAGFLSREEASPDYDADTADAVEEFQERSGLAVTGVVNEKTWDALFDISAKEWDISGARIMPLVQKSKVREWNYTATGAKIGRNSNYDPSVINVDRNVDFGAGVTEQQARRWMRGQMKRLDGKSWAGTITLAEGVGAFLGEHNDAELVTDADVIAARDIQPGWNVWLPNFDGGTLVHVAQVSVDSGRVTLTVDTHYRDAIELGEILRRNRESRRDPRREWVLEYRGSKKIHDSITPFNQKAGVNWQARPCAANKWTVFPVFAGQAGTVSKLRLSTGINAAFACAIFADKITAATLSRRIPNPMPVDEDGETVWSNPALEDWFNSGFLLYSAGNEEQPCGYWPKKHTNRDRVATAAPLTGVWQDDASFGYATFRLPALWIAVYPTTATTINRGRILWAQLESGV